MNYFISSVIRNIRRNALHTSINVFGLVLGFTCLILISVWIKTELSYDRFHEKSNNIYRVHRYFYDANGEVSLHLPNVAPNVGPLLKDEFPEILNIARIYQTGMVFTLGERRMEERNVCFAEPDVLSIFSFEGLPADKNLLVEPFTVIISESVANRYFNEPDVTGRMLGFLDERGKDHALQISGVFNEWNQPGHFKPDVIISFSTFESFVSHDDLSDWSSNNYTTFALMPHLPVDFDSKLDAFIDSHLENGTQWTKIRIERLIDIHFNWYGSRIYIYILATIAILILVIGSINYMNLNMVVYYKRLKEIKIRKILGASREKITVQLLAESVLICFMALIVALYLAFTVMPEFSSLFGIPVNFVIFENFELIVGFFLLSILTGVLSVFYPISVLASFNPVISKSPEEVITGKSNLRNGLVVFQFMVSISLIISFITVFKQLDYLQDKKLGLNKENIIIIPATSQLIDNLETFKQQLARNPNILTVSASKRVPSDGLWDSQGARVISGENITQLGFRLANIIVDEQFIPTYKIRLTAGRNFSDDINNEFNYILNETAARRIGWESPRDAIGQVIEYGGKRGNVIGVTEDFHYESLHNPISPIIMLYSPPDANLISINIAPFELDSTLEYIENIWQTYNISNFPFSFDYAADRDARLYGVEERIRTMLSYFMIIAISIAVLGLMGISVSLIEQRTKEIGIRKVNGARDWEVMAMLNLGFVKWVGIAFLFATPIAWYAMSRWLQNFAYRTELSWWVFVLAGLLALGIALLTVSWQSWRAAGKNPVEALRYE